MQNKYNMNACMPLSLQYINIRFENYLCMVPALYDLERNDRTRKDGAVHAEEA